MYLMTVGAGTTTGLGRPFSPSSSRSSGRVSWLWMKSIPESSCCDEMRCVVWRGLGLEVSIHPTAFTCNRVSQTIELELPNLSSPILAPNGPVLHMEPVTCSSTTWSLLCSVGHTRFEAGGQNPTHLRSNNLGPRVGVGVAFQGSS